MRRMKDKIEGTITNADSALAVENLSASVDVASSGQSADITLSSLTKAKAKLSVAVTGVATMAKKGTTDLTIDVPNQNDLLNALTNDDIDAITGGMVDDDGNPIKPNEVIVDASLTVSGRAADAKVTGTKISEALSVAKSADAGLTNVRTELDKLKLDSVAVDKTLTKENFAADAKVVGEKFKSIKTDWNSVTDKPSTFPSTWGIVSGKPNSYPPSEHNHSKLAFEQNGEVNFVGTPQDNTVYWGYRDNTIDEYRFNDGRGNGAFANVRANKFIGSLDGNANTATTATGVTDYKNPTKIIQVGYAGDGLTTSNLTHIAGYTDDGTKIKDVSKDVLKSWLGVSANAIASSGSNYIRFSDGTQICWGGIQDKVTFPIAFATTSYCVGISNGRSGGTFVQSVPYITKKTTTNMEISIAGYGDSYIAIGRWK